MPPDERLSMAEQLSATYDKLEAEAPEREEPAVVEPEPVETEEAKAERVRDEAGRFKAEPREKLTLKPREAKDAAPEQKREAPRESAGKEVPLEGNPAGPLAGAQPDKQTQPILPPSNWSGKGKVQWERLHHDLKVELSQELSKAGEMSTKFGPVGTALAPYEQRLQQEFGGVDRGVAAVLGTWKFARSEPEDFTAQFVQQYGGQSPVDFIRRVAQRCGIDPQALGLGGGGSQQQPGGNAAEQLSGDPALTALKQDLEAIKAERQREAEARTTQQHQQIHADIQAFGNETDKASGVLAHPYFNDVKIDMGALMAAGRAKTMQEAYEKACWADPQIRTELQREVERKATEARKQAVAKASLAGGSVTGSPGVARSETHVSQSARADLLKNWDAMEARV